MNTKSKIHIRKAIYILLIIIAILSIIYIVKYFYDFYISKKQTNLLNEITISEQTNFIVENNLQEPVNQYTKPERILKLEELKKQNSEIIGWVEIENTDINYPVLQAKDNDFYMNHNYKGEYSSAGAIFLDKDYNWDIPSSNLLIYGHNMKNSTMFQNLLKYNSIDFYKEHPIIRFTTLQEDADYEIVGAFYSKVYFKTDKNVFKYYQFINAQNEDEYNNFIQNVKKSSLYDTGIDAKYDDQLITLSTCSYHTADGRFVVVGRKK